MSQLLEQGSYEDYIVSDEDVIKIQENIFQLLTETVIECQVSSLSLCFVFLAF